MRIKALAALAVVALSLSACATPGQNQYDWTNAGQAIETEFGTVVDINPVHIQNPNTGIGAGAGGLAGAGIGSQIGNGNGQLAGALVGLVVGVVAGGIAEHEMQNKDGFAYTVTLKNGKTITIAQYKNSDDAPIHVGERVMVQTSGTYQRVLPASHLPTQIKRPKGITFSDGHPKHAKKKPAPVTDDDTDDDAE